MDHWILSTLHPFDTEVSVLCAAGDPAQAPALMQSRLRGTKTVVQEQELANAASWLASQIAAINIARVWYIYIYNIYIKVLKLFYG